MKRGEKPEILSPAGDLERLKTAILYGADAVYLGGKEFGMRAGAGNFSNEELIEGVAYAHRHKARVYVTCNTVPTNMEIEAIPAFFQFLKEIEVDGIIVSDMGVLALAKEYAPGIDIHMSTQAGVVNHVAANELYKMGVRRVVLARELDLEQIRVIRDNTPQDLEIEAFVHGSMCMAFSGRCLLSHYMVNRDANRGECAQPCRWGYYLMEEKRPGEYHQIFEDEHGSYIMNAKDMCTIEHIHKLVEAGITSFKIEGRAKANYYVAVVTNAYRMAMDLYFEDPEHFVCPDWLKEEVNKVSHRHYNTGFYFGPPQDSQCYDSGGYIRNYTVIGEVQGWENGYMVMYEKNKFSKGEVAELVQPGEKPITFTIEEIIGEDGTNLEEAVHPMELLKVKFPKEVSFGAIVRVPRDKP